MKKISATWLIIGIVVLIIGLLVWSKFLQNNDPEIISRSGLHWHPELVVYVKGEKQEIPANLGLGAVHKPIHTHTEDAAQGVIHLEFQGLVQKDDTKLGQFFTIWGKDIGVFGTNMKMTVNGKENTEYENYLMQDKDKIELHYE